MKKGIYSLCFAVLIIFSSTLLSQDIHFTQTINTPLLLNPAFCGIYDGHFRIMNSYKQQWSSVSTQPYKTFLFATDKSFLNKKLNTGLFFFNDKAGIMRLNTNQMELLVSSILRSTKKDQMSVGIQFGYTQKSFVTTDLIWDSQWDGANFNQSLPTNEKYLSTRFNYFDLSCGGSWNHRQSKNSNMQMGLAAYHLNNPRLKFAGNNTEKLYTKYITTFNWEIKDNTTSNITYVPAITWVKQGTANEFVFSLVVKKDLGLNSIYTEYFTSSCLMFGGFCRWNDALAPYVGYEYKKSLLGSISYDINYSKLNKASFMQGGFEFHLSYRITDKK